MKMVFIIFTQRYILPKNRRTVMDFPSSSTLPEIFLQYTELNYIVHLARKHKLLGYFQYGDDIMIIYDQYATKINLVYGISLFHRAFQFTMCNGPTNALVCNTTLIQMSHIKTLKITPTCFDHQMIIIRELFDPS
jgi:hypothetical protein